jgi:hypothetical protein
MTIERSADVTQRSTTSLVGGTIRHYLGGRRGLIILGAAALVLGIAFNWGWLVAAGIAPILLTALPCVAMCALGLCMNKMTNNPREAQTPSTDATLQAAPPAPPPLPPAASLEESATPLAAAAAPLALATSPSQPTTRPAIDGHSSDAPGTKNDSCCHT